MNGTSMFEIAAAFLSMCEHTARKKPRGGWGLSEKKSPIGRHVLGAWYPSWKSKTRFFTSSLHKACATCEQEKKEKEKCLLNFSGLRGASCSGTIDQSLEIESAARREGLVFFSPQLAAFDGNCRNVFAVYSLSSFPQRDTL